MKNLKKLDEMMTISSKNQLSVFRSGIFDSDNKETVISCGYTKGNKFGYFICKEKVTTCGDPHKEVYEYTDQVAFYPKENEKTYQRVLEDVKRMVANGQG